jgi:hypothetical protein
VALPGRAWHRPQVANGKPGDDPVTDVVVHHADVFGSEADDLIRDIVYLGGEGYLRRPPLHLMNLDPRLHGAVNLEDVVRQLRGLRDRLRERARQRGWEVD